MTDSEKFTTVYDEHHGLAGVRVRLTSERTPAKTVEFIRLKAEADGVWDDRLRARCELAVDDSLKLKDLMPEFMSADERFRFGEWLDGEKFTTYEELDAVLGHVIERYRSDLAEFRIAILFQEAIPPYLRRHRLGTAMKLPGKVRFLSEVDAVVAIDYGFWLALTLKDRQRLVHHELEHLKVDKGDDGVNRLALRAHDFEDFTSIVDLYGLRSESGNFSLDDPSARSLEEATATTMQTRLGLDEELEETS